MDRLPHLCPPRGPRLALLTLLLGVLPGAASAQRLEIEVTGPAGPLDASTSPLVLAADRDDDDEDGQRDAEQPGSVPGHDLLEVRVHGAGPVRVRAEGPIRLLRHGQPLGLPWRSTGERVTLQVQGLSASAHPGDAVLHVEPLARDTVDGARALRFTVVALRMLDGLGRPLTASRDAVGVSREITNLESLPRHNGYDVPSPDADNVRLEIRDPAITVDSIEAVLESLDPYSGTPRHRIPLTLSRPKPGLAFRSPYVRLVGDATDLSATGVQGQLLLVGLRDVLRLRYATPEGVAQQRLRVGRPGREDGPQAARSGRLRIRILRMHAGGPPVIGGDEASALRIAREQVQIANEVWLQCYLDFGLPDRADVDVVAPPPPSLLSVADGDGLPARGGGLIRLRADGHLVDGIETRPGDRPVQTAMRIAQALQDAGFDTEVTENQETEFGAGRSADVLVRDALGRLVHLEPADDAPLSSDRRQKLTIGVVDLADGLQEFNNMNAAAGTLEERALVKALGDRDPGTIDVFVVNRFTQGTRQGEAFIEASEGAILNTLILDRNGLKQQRTAWTMPHELGHVLLNHAFHPDNFGPDRPWLLMDSDNNRGLVSGPKRLTEAECRRVRAESGVDAIPALLRRHRSPSLVPDARHTPPMQVSAGPLSRQD